MRTLSRMEATVIGGGVVNDPGTCANAMLGAGGLGAGFGAVIGGLIGVLGDPAGVAFGAVLGAALIGGGSSAVAAQGSACQPELMCTPDNLH